jgi:ketosteroid isomerase-like protein
MKEIHQSVLSEFYTAFQRKDYRKMQSLYHDEASFSDPVFQNLNTNEVRCMWEMLLTSAKDLKIEFRDIQANEQTGSAHWEAWYTFTKTGRQVHNIIDASFEFRDGKILRHSDQFDFWRWSRHAMGISGMLFGWSPMVKSKVRTMAIQRLEKFCARGT